MADWKTHLNYNYNSAYLAYLFQPGQNAGNLCESQERDFSSSNVGVTQTYYTTTAETQVESPPRTPEQQVSNGHNHYQGPGVLYISATQTDRILLTGSRQAVYTERTLEAKRGTSDSTSDSETYVSSDSWGSNGNKEESLLQTDPTTWNKKDHYQESNDKRAIGSEDVSSSFTEQLGNGYTDGTHSPQSATKNRSTTNAKAKARTAFSESQMNVLVHKFSVQRYLPPAEMKNLAEVTGLTYKQVRTWFQNRRMKLRRHQKDTSWVSERYTINNDSSVQGTVYNIPPYSTSYQGESQHRMDSAFKNTSSQNVAFYMATMAPGSTGYPSWTTVPCQTAVPIRTQQRDWTTNPHVFSVAGIANDQCPGFESKNEAVDRS